MPSLVRTRQRVQRARRLAPHVVEDDDDREVLAVGCGRRRRERRAVTARQRPRCSSAAWRAPVVGTLVLRHARSPTQSTRSIGVVDARSGAELVDGRAALGVVVVVDDARTPPTASRS